MQNAIQKSNISVSANGIESDISISSREIQNLLSVANKDLPNSEKAQLMQKAVNAFSVVKVMTDNINDIFKKLGYRVDRVADRVQLFDLYSKRIAENKDYEIAQGLVYEIKALLDEAIERKNSICEHCNGTGDEITGSNPNYKQCSYCGGTGEV